MRAARMRAAGIPRPSSSGTLGTTGARKTTRKPSTRKPALAKTVFGLLVLERELWPNDVVIVWLMLPFPYGRKPFVTSGDEKTMRRVRVRLANLHGTQRRVTSAGVGRYLHGEADRLPMVYRSKDGDFIADGHHRLTAAWLRGERTALVNLVDVSGRG